MGTTRRRKPTAAPAGARDKVPFIQRQLTRVRRATAAIEAADKALKRAEGPWAEQARIATAGALLNLDAADTALHAAPEAYKPPRPQRRAKPAPFAAGDRVQLAEHARAAHKDTFFAQIEFGTTAVGEVVDFDAAQKKVTAEFGGTRARFDAKELVRVAEVALESEDA